MNKTLNSVLIILAVLVLASVIFFAGAVYARSNMMFGWNTYGQFGSGMMGQGGMMDMMGGYGGMTLAPGASAGVNRYSTTNLSPLTIDQAKTAAEQYLVNIDQPNLKIAEIMIFDNNAYVVAEEADTGLGAFELLVDPVSQIAYPEHGSNMMWNLKYSGLNHQSVTLAPRAGVRNNGWMMGSNGGMMNMMGNYSWYGTVPTDVSAEMTITSEQAIEYAQDYLDKNISGTVVATDPIQFYGYYTLDFEKDGKIAGMLSVNGNSGQVFLHTWHGMFIEEAE